MITNAHPTDLPVPPGELVNDKYKIEAKLGKGGMGIVARATHVKLGEPVAIKFLSPDRANDPEYAQRFLREARIGARIKSPHAVQVVDVDITEAGAPYLVMELLTGEDLHTLRKRRGKLPPEEAAELVAQVCEALAAAHALGIVHRDLKPSNLHVGRDGRGNPIVKVLDFGISKLLWEGEDADPLTTPNTLLGSVSYMSPEQIRSTSDVDARADLWSVGVILYELLAGKRPFQARETQGVMQRILMDAPTPISEHAPDVPPALARVILRCLEKDVARRTQSAEELLDALAPFRRAGAESTNGAAIPRDTLPGAAAAISRPPSTPPPDTAAPGTISITLSRRTLRRAVAVVVTLTAGAAAALYVGRGLWASDATPEGLGAASPRPALSANAVAPARSAPSATAPALAPSTASAAPTAAPTGAASATPNAAPPANKPLGQSAGSKGPVGTTTTWRAPSEDPYSTGAAIPENKAPEPPGTAAAATAPPPQPPACAQGDLQCLRSAWGRK